RLLGLVVLRPSRTWVDAREHGVVDVGLGVRETNGICATLEHPEVTVTRRVDEGLDRPVSALDVDQDRRRDLVPVPRVVPVILVVPAQLAGIDVQAHHRGRVEVVAGSLIANPLRRVASAPVCDVERGVVRAGDPRRHTARLPSVALPGLPSGLTRSRDRERLPRETTGTSVEGLDEAPDAEFAAG